jgi:hypothetical protein|tara:strand:+ start:221 stop:586 length:366 start_codon:yes stop_codon:yes gene_type:complete
MFNFFNKKKKTEPQEEEIEQEQDDDDDISAAITYYITRDGAPFVDVKLCDYDASTIINLSELLKGIHSGEYFPDTIDMIRDGFIEKGEPELYITVAAKIGAAIISQTDEQPCINPSDVFKM